MRPEHWLFTIPLRLRLLFRWARADQELDDELRDHLERKTQEYVAHRIDRFAFQPGKKSWSVQKSRRKDRKSTRLNSSHGYISYAVFCLKKKKKTTNA